MGRQRLWAHPGEAAQSDCGILKQAARQAPSGHLQQQQQSRAERKLPCAQRLKGRAWTHALRQVEQQASNNLAADPSTGRHLQYHSQPLQRLQRNRLQLLAAALDGQLACRHGKGSKSASGGGMGGLTLGWALG